MHLSLLPLILILDFYFSCLPTPRSPVWLDYYVFQWSQFLLNLHDFTFVYPPALQSAFCNFRFLLCVLFPSHFLYFYPLISPFIGSGKEFRLSPSLSQARFTVFCHWWFLPSLLPSLLSYVHLSLLIFLPLFIYSYYFMVLVLWFYTIVLPLSVVSIIMIHIHMPSFILLLMFHESEAFLFWVVIQW